MRRYLFRRKGLFFLTLTAILFFNLISAECSILKQKLVDAVLEPKADNVLWYMLFVLGANVLYGLFYMAYQLLQNAFSVTVIDDMRKSIFLGVMQQSRKDFFHVNYSDYISVITNDLNLIKTQFLGMLFMAITFGGSLVCSAVLMFWYSPTVTVAAVLCAALMTILPMILSKKMKQRSEKYSQKLSELNTLLTELFSGFSVLRSFGAMGHAKEKFDKYSSDLKKSEQKYKGMDTFLDAFAQFLSVVAQTFILVLSAWMVIQGRMSAGVLVAFSSLNGWFCSSLSIVLMAIPMLRSIKPVVDRVNGLVDTKIEKRDVCIPSFQTVLEVKNLSFRYEKDRLILKELNLTIRSGEKCALLGKSGSGKTTLIRLLTGELDGYLGQICYDGVELSDTDRETVCNIVSVIHQDVFLFDDTIYNNICLFDTFSKESFEQAVHLSGVSKFIHQFPEGADYRVGQRGEFLSGGQRQRIAIARALIRHTPFLILDEGTSALDEQTAKEIESELINIPDLTLLTITHHLHNPKNYTQVIEL